MKKLMMSIFIVTALASCSSENEIIDNGEIKGDERVEIKLRANILDVQTKAVVDGLKNDIDNVAFLRTDGATADWSKVTEIRDAKIAATTGDITFTVPQYYPIDKAVNAHFIGFMPKTGATVSGSTVTWTGMDGTQDIMHAPVVSGNKESKNTALLPAFTHKLTQVSFKSIGATGFESGAKVKSIVIKDVTLPASINITTGVVTYSTTPEDLTITPSDSEAGITEGTATDLTSSVRMFKPSSDGVKVLVTVTTANNTDITYPETTINLTTQEGTSHTVTLEFAKATVSGTATVAEWKIDNAEHKGTFE